MIPLDLNLCRILAILLEAEKPISAKSIAVQLGITPRRARYRIHQVGCWLKLRNLALASQPGHGFYLATSAEARNELCGQLAVEAEESPRYSRLERTNWIILNFLNCNQPLPIKHLQYELGVSRTTILKDLAHAERWLEQCNIRLLKRQNFGCQILAAEVDIRQAIVKCLLESIEEVDLLTTFGGLKSAIQTHQRLPAILHRGTSQFLESLELGYFNNLIHLIQEIEKERFTDRSHVILVLQIAVLLSRLQCGKLVEIAETDIEVIRSQSFYHLAVIIAKNIKQTFDVSMLGEEVAYIAMLLAEADKKRPLINRAEKRNDLAVCDERIFSVVSEIIEHAALFLHPRLKIDSELRDSLTYHLESIVDQPGRSAPNGNPLLEDIKRVYPYAFKVARTCLADLDGELVDVITEDEVGFITMHLAAALERLHLPASRKRKVVIVCNAGIATTKLLVSRVLTEFPEVEISGVMSYLEYKKQRDIEDYDLVISTIPISAWEKPAIVVGPLLNQEDVAQIKSILGLKEPALSIDKQSRLHDNARLPLAKLLTANTIRLQAAASDWRNAVEIAAAPLLEIAAIEARYIQSIQSILAEHGPYMVIMPGIALLHAYPEDGVRRLCMSLATYQRPVNFGHEKFDPVFLAVTLGSTDNYSHLQALAGLVNMLQDEGAVHLIKNSYLKAQILNIISRFSDTGV